MTSRIGELPFEVNTAKPGIVMRQITGVDDAVYLESYDFSRPEIARFDPDALVKYLTIEDVAASHIANRMKNRVRYGIWDSGTYVGMFGQTETDDGLEIGYITDSRHAGNGYATLATQTMVAVDFPLYDRIFAEVVEGNDASLRVLEKCGFAEVARNAGRITLDYSPINN